MLVNKVKKDKKCIYISICMIVLLSLSGCNKAEQIKETDIQKGFEAEDTKREKAKFGVLD